MMEWQCIGHNPTTWALGRREGERLEGIVAQVTRRDDGKWNWRCGDQQGIEPSCETAQEAAEFLYVVASRLPSPPGVEKG